MATMATLRSCVVRSKRLMETSSPMVQTIYSKSSTTHQQQQRGVLSFALSRIEEGISSQVNLYGDSQNRLGSIRGLAIRSPYGLKNRNKKRVVPQEPKEDRRGKPQDWIQIDPADSPFCVVDHGAAYEKAIQGFHGQTLEKAKREGKGKDDPMFDPFYEDELLEQRLDQEEEEEARKAAIDAGEEEEEEEGVQEDGEGEDRDDDDSLEEKNQDNMTEKEKKEYLTRVMYNADGSVRRKASQYHILRAGYPAGGQFAIIEMDNTQYKVTTDDLLIVNRLKPQNVWSVGSVHTLDQVLLCGTTHLTLVGMPYVAGATVTVMIEEITKDEKVIIFKKRRRKHSQRKRGFRRDITMLRVLDISFPDQYAEHVYVPRVEPDLLPPRPDPRSLKDSTDDEENDEEDEEIAPQRKQTA